MTTIHAITLAFGVVGFPAYFLTKRKSQVQTTDGQQKNQNWLEQLRLDRNPYQSLRFLAITTPPYKYEGIKEESVYGVIMDYPVKNGTATLATYATGESSLYMSNGSGIINGERYESVRQASMELVKLAARHIDCTVPTTRYPAASAGFVRFYVLTTKGVRTCWIRMGETHSENPGESLLFIEANKVIRSLQLTTALN